MLSVTDDSKFAVDRSPSVLGVLPLQVQRWNRADEFYATRLVSLSSSGFGNLTFFLLLAFAPCGTWLRRAEVAAFSGSGT